MSSPNNIKVKKEVLRTIKLNKSECRRRYSVKMKEERSKVVKCLIRWVLIVKKCGITKVVEAEERK